MHRPFDASIWSQSNCCWCCCSYRLTIIDAPIHVIAPCQSLLISSLFFLEQSLSANDCTDSSALRQISRGVAFRREELINELILTVHRLCFGAAAALSPLITSHTVSSHCWPTIIITVPLNSQWMVIYRWMSCCNYWPQWRSFSITGQKSAVNQRIERIKQTHTHTESSWTVILESTASIARTVQHFQWESIKINERQIKSDCANYSSSNASRLAQFAGKAIPAENAMEPFWCLLVGALLSLSLSSNHNHCNDSLSLFASVCVCVPITSQFGVTELKSAGNCITVSTPLILLVKRVRPIAN